MKSRTAPASNVNAEATTAPNSEEIKLAPQRLRAQSEGTLVVDVQLPAGYHLNAAAPQRYKVSIDNGASQSLALLKTAGTVTDSGKLKQLPLHLPLRAGSAGASLLRVSVTLYYCREDNTGVCRIKTLAWRVPVEAAPGAAREIKLTGKVD